ncbi:MAG TPA: Uma2 family endonuclease [Blastocatellia bacterium]|nr:Uma2 family endonuclease [Blastocatellia bacterium]
MSTAVRETGTTPFVIHFGQMLNKISDDDFFEFCQLNREWRIERTSNGDVIFMPPTGGETGGRNFDLTGSFYVWAKADGTGKGFDSSTGFTLPNGAKRSPDLAWVRLSRWNTLTDEERKQFPPLCPDFVVELRSESDSLADLHAKMREYIDNGAQLGWLIDPVERKVYMYRPNAEIERIENPETVSGDPLLPGFVLAVRELWQ